jgi:ATP-binding protein involved in chromosome partitioning
MISRTYRDLQEPDRSGLGEQVARQRERVRRRLAQVRRVVAVMSGKGGVGKSYVTAHLALALARAGRAVGVLDADFNGPTTAKWLDAEAPANVRLRVHDDAVDPVIARDGIRCISMSHLLENGQPLAFRGPEHDGFIWRGAAEAAALREFLSDVRWGELDLLLVDLPPGIERGLELCDLLDEPPEGIAVTIPTPESEAAVRRALRAGVERGIRMIGIVENMVGPQFPGEAGPTLARDFTLPLLARLSFFPATDVWRELGARVQDLALRPSPFA